jgi:hypothetical protein
MISFFKQLGMAAIALLPLMSFGALQMGNVQVGKASGNVSLIDAKSQRKPLTAGLVFQEGNRIETAADSTAELVFSNGASLILTPGTLLEVRTFRQVPSAAIVDPYRQIKADPSPSVTEVEVTRGKIIGEVRKLNSLSTFTVKTPVGLTRIRGTVFIVEYLVKDGIGQQNVTCVRGSVVSSVEGGNTGLVTIDPGYSSSFFKPVEEANILQKRIQEGIQQLIRSYIFTTPSEWFSDIALFLTKYSTLPPEVPTTIGSMAPTAPKQEDVFPNGSTVPVEPYGRDITNGPVDGEKKPIAKVSSPDAPMTLSNGGGGTTYDESLKKIYDNVNRSVEMKQLNPTPTGG